MYLAGTLPSPEPTPTYPALPTTLQVCTDNPARALTSGRERTVLHTHTQISNLPPVHSRSLATQALTILNLAASSTISKRNNNKDGHGNACAKLSWFLPQLASSLGRCAANLHGGVHDEHSSGYICWVAQFPK